MRTIFSILVLCLASFAYAQPISSVPKNLNTRWLPSTNYNSMFFQEIKKGTSLPRVTDSSGNVLASLTSGSGGTPTYSYGKLTLANAQSVGSYFVEMYPDEDPANTTVNALWLTSTHNGGRIYFGKSGKGALLNLTYVTGVENMPAFSTADNFTHGYLGAASHMIGRTTDNIIINNGQGTTSFWMGTGYSGVSSGSVKRWEIATNGNVVQTLGSASVVGHTIKLASTPTANAIEVQTSGGTVLSGIDASGRLYAPTALTASTVGAAGGASALPATPTGYLLINVNGTQMKVPYYAN